MADLVLVIQVIHFAGNTSFFSSSTLPTNYPQRTPLLSFYECACGKEELEIGAEKAHLSIGKIDLGKKRGGNFALICL